MKRSTPVVALTLLLLAGARANADFIQWSYNWNINPISVLSDSGNGSVSFTNQPSQSATGNSDTVATNLKANSLADPANPDTLSNTGAYTLTMSLTDTASGQSGTVSFSGKLSGTFSKSSANITNAFTGATSEKLTLGGNVYTVTIGPYSPPGPPNSASPGPLGSIAAHVDVAPDSGGITGASSPEPSSLLLGLFALTGAGVYSRRKLRAKAV
jgi:hypothetical protein